MYNEDHPIVLECYTRRLAQVPWTKDLIERIVKQQNKLKHIQLHRSTSICYIPVDVCLSYLKTQKVPSSPPHEEDAIRVQLVYKKKFE